MITATSSAFALGPLSQTFPRAGMRDSGIIGATETSRKWKQDEAQMGYKRMSDDSAMTSALRPGADVEDAASSFKATTPQNKHRQNGTSGSGRREEWLRRT